MCLIVCKPEGVAMPSLFQLDNWFSTHPDGMGLAFPDASGFMRILKGGMTTTDMRLILDSAEEYIKPCSFIDMDIVFHFRQATEGSVCAGNTHPYPITEDATALQAQNVLTDIALAHNGIIWDYSTYTNKKWVFNMTAAKTDTQSFIEEHLVGLGKTIWNKSVQELIAAYTDSKFALLSKRGITLIGDFVKDGGLMFSNGSYDLPKPSVGMVTYYPPKDSLDQYGAENYGYADRFGNYDGACAEAESKRLKGYDGKDDSTQIYVTDKTCDACGDYYGEDEMTDVDGWSLCPCCVYGYSNGSL